MPSKATNRIVFPRAFLSSDKSGTSFCQADLSKVVGSSYRVKSSRCICTVCAPIKDLAEDSSAMKTIPIASADIFPRWLEACWVASRGSPAAYSALIAAALIVDLFAVLLVLASWAAWGVPA